MRRVWMMLPIAALAFAGFTPAQAQTDDAYPTEDTPIVLQCKGTFGLNSDGDFEFKQGQVSTGVVNPWTCVTWAPDTASPLPSDLPPPDVFGVIRWLLDATHSVPVGQPASATLRANGDYACGGGVLSSAEAERLSSFGYWHGLTSREWLVNDWSASFSNGVGEISGTATQTWPRDSDEVRDVSGTLVVGSPSLQCNDAGAEATLTLVLE